MLTFPFRRMDSILVVLAGCLHSGFGQSYSLEFGQRAYDFCPGEEVMLEVHLKPVPPGGLFSYGIRITPLGGGSLPYERARIDIPPDLDYNGLFGPGAQQVLSAELIAAKGTTDFFADPLVFHQDSLLATLTITNAGMGSWVLGLDRYETIGPNESVFVDGDLNSLDESMSYRSATLDVGVPRPVIEQTLNPGGDSFTSRLTFLTCPGYDYFAQYTDDLGADAAWTEVTGAPHNEGLAIDVTSVLQRFYRVEIRPQSVSSAGLESD